MACAARIGLALDHPFLRGTELASTRRGHSPTGVCRDVDAPDLEPPRMCRGRGQDHRARVRVNAGVFVDHLTFSIAAIA